MPKETLNTRVTTLETAMLKLTNSMNHLAEVQAQQTERLTELRVEEAKRDERQDERIGKLVSAIGELISQMKAGGSNGKH